MRNMLRQFWNDDSGVTAMEYGLIAGLIALVIVTAVTNAGVALNGIFTTIQTKLDAANAAAGGGTGTGG